MLRRFLAPLLMLGLLFAAPAARASDFDLNGLWQGVINFDKEAFLSQNGTPAEGRAYRIAIDGEDVHLFLAHDGGFFENAEGAVHIAQVKSNAVIYATAFSPPSADGVYWVETWTFTVTLKDADTLLAEYVRVVHNVGVPAGAESASFATRGAGEFKRVDASPPAGTGGN
jgi:hypothetical protein